MLYVYTKAIIIIDRKGGENISGHQKMGRPTTSPKTRILHMRMDEETVQKLKQAAEALDITMSDVVRKGIGLVHDSLKK